MVEASGARNMCTLKRETGEWRRGVQEKRKGMRRDSGHRDQGKKVGWGVLWRH